MKSVFADTFHFLALLKADDAHHRRALEFHRVKWQRIITTDCVLLEVGDACSHPDIMAIFWPYTKHWRKMNACKSCG
jgi:hypothetical protein